MKTVIYKHTSDFEALESDWNDLLEKSDTKNIFLTFEWLFTWWRYFGNQYLLFLIAVYDGGQILGIAPLMISKELGFRRLRFISSRFADFEDIVICGNTAVREEVLNTVISTLKHEISWDLFHLQGIKQSSQTAELLQNSGWKNSAIGLQLKEHHERNLFLETTGSWGDYLKSLDKRYLSDTRRLMKRLLNEGNVEFQDCSAQIEKIPEILDKHMNWHIKKRAQTKSSSIFKDPLNRRFFNEAVLKFSKKGCLDLTCALINGTLSAVHIGFRFRGHFFSYLISYDENYGRCGIGRLLFFNMIERCFKTDIRKFDFMLGEEPYKNSFNPQSETLLFAVGRKRTLRGRMGGILLDDFKFKLKETLGLKC